MINLEGVTVTRVQTKKKDPKVGSWDWYHVKSWDVAPNHFAFKIVGADSNVTNYMFDTKQVCERRPLLMAAQSPHWQPEYRLGPSLHRRRQLRLSSRTK